MGIRTDTFSIGEYYHLYSRGVDKRAIFLDLNDKKRFVRLLYLCNSTQPVVYREVRNLPLKKVEVKEKLVSIGAYCLMPNHFHILVKEVEEGGIRKFMSKLLTAYSTYFNKKYERTGALFGSEFKSSHLDKDEYLRHIFAYIHLNPLKIRYPLWREHGLSKEEVKKVLSSYPFSSYEEYIGIYRDDESRILNIPDFPEYFRNVGDFEEYILDWFIPEEGVRSDSAAEPATESNF